MLSGIILFSIVTLLMVISYRRPRLEQRVINNIPLVDWMNLLFFPLFLYFGLVLIVVNILQRPNMNIIDFDDVQLLSVGILFLVYLFVGNSIHFVGKVLSRYMAPGKHGQLFKINELFHGKLSHYITLVCALLTIFIVGLLEVNHPSWVTLSAVSLYLLLLCGLLLGISASKIVFYTSDWYGGYNKPLLILSVTLESILFGMFQIFHLKMSMYPINVFLTSFFFFLITAFILKRLLRASKWGKQKSFRFLMRILSG
jgi:hypothetical protein